MSKRMRKKQEAHECDCVVLHRILLYEMKELLVKDKKNCVLFNILLFYSQAFFHLQFLYS